MEQVFWQISATLDGSMEGPHRDRPGRALRATLAAAVFACGWGDRDAASGAGEWRFEVDTVGSATEGAVRHTSRLRVVGKEGPEGKGRANDVILSFDCLKDHTSSAIMTKQALRQGSVEARLTVDGGTPRRVPGFAGTTTSGGQVVLTIPQDSLLAVLAGHQTAVIEYADGAGSSRSIAEFPIAGVEEYRGPFLAACAKR